MKSFISLILFSVYTFQLRAQDSLANDRYSVESATELINVAKKVKQGEIVSEANWERLFQTDGYRNYLTAKNAQQMKEWIKKAILVAFSSNRKAEADSIATIPVNLDSPLFIPILMMQNFYCLSKRLEQAETFIINTDFATFLDQAHRRTKEFLPARAYADAPELNRTYIIGTIPDASVRNKSVFLDLNLALDYTEEELLNLFAHEFHHNYRDIKIPDSMKDPLLNIINSMHAEGIADLIDKKGVPFTHLSTYGPDMLEIYTQDFLNTPKTLMDIDSIACAYIQRKADSSAYAKMGDMIKFGGHTNGFYMALVIKNKGGIRDLIDSYDDPIVFIKLYNKAARKSNNEYVFSTEFISYIEMLWRDYESARTKSSPNK